MQNNYQLCVAPMMAWTDRHCRRLHRLIAPRTRLYTEMVTTHALLNADPKRLLRYSAEEKPLALQLGGSDPEHLALCSKMAEQYGFDEVNLNVGCPSPRVQRADIGACLMQQPQLVASCVDAMQSRVSIPITVKCRIGIDAEDSYEFLSQFISAVADAGVSVFFIHARKAILKGLSPAQNRHAPPLNYERVYTLKKNFPALKIILNGGIQSIEQAAMALKNTDGIMLGRAAYQNPLLLQALEQKIFGESRNYSPREALEAYLLYVQKELESGTRLQSITRHLLGLFNGIPGARNYRRYLSENARLENAGIQVLKEALLMIQDNPSQTPHKDRAYSSC